MAPIESLSSLSLLLLLSTTLLFSSSSSAHNITRILSKHPKFSIFSSLLSSTNLTEDINRRSPITVLAVSNASIAGIVDLNPNIQRHILSVHVILDYFDLEKLQNLESHPTFVATLFQTSGVAEGRTGFLNITKFADGRIVFRSAADRPHHKRHVAKLVGPIATRPYNISVLHVSTIIEPPSITGHHHHNNSTPPSPLPPAPTAAEAPAIEPVAPVADEPAGDSPEVEPAGDSPEVEPPKGAVDDKVKSNAGRRVAIGTGVGAFIGVALFALQ